MLQTELSTLSSIDSSPVTSSQTLPQKQQTDELSTTSQSSIMTTASSQTTIAPTDVSYTTEESNTTTSSQTTIAPTEVSNKTEESNNTTTSSQTTIAPRSTENSSKTEAKTTLPVHPPPPPKLTTRPAKNIHTSTTVTPNPKLPNDASSDFKTTIILVVVFGLIVLIPAAIFIHCRMKRKSQVNFGQIAKKDDKEKLTQNNKTDLNNKT